MKVAMWSWERVDGGSERAVQPEHVKSHSRGHFPLGERHLGRYGSQRAGGQLSPGEARAR